SHTRMVDDNAWAARKQRAVERLLVGSFDAEALSDLSMAELIELSSRTDIMRIPEMRHALQQLIQVRQSHELGERLREGTGQLIKSVGTLHEIITKSSKNADRLSRTMVCLTWAILGLTAVLVVAALAPRALPRVRPTPRPGGAAPPPPNNARAARARRAPRATPPP